MSSGGSSITTLESIPMDTNQINGLPSTVTQRMMPTEGKKSVHHVTGVTAKGDKRKYVEHSYMDRSKDIIENITESDENTLRMYKEDSLGGTFPIKLQIVLKVLEKIGQGHIISWLPHGRSFMIHRPREFENDVMGKFFKQTKLTSFQRQLNLYDFQRITQGRDAGAYYHELFLRGRPLLSKRMVRRKVKGTKIRASSSPDDEPNFYQMSFMGPLADDPTPFDHHTVGAPGQRSFLNSITPTTAGEDARNNIMNSSPSSAAFLTASIFSQGGVPESLPSFQGNMQSNLRLQHQNEGAAGTSTSTQEKLLLLKHQYYGRMRDTNFSSDALRNSLMFGGAHTIKYSSSVGENFPRSLYYDSTSAALFPQARNNYSSLLGTTNNGPMRALAQQQLDIEARLLQSADDRMAMLNHEAALLERRARTTGRFSQEEQQQQAIQPPTSLSREVVDSNLSCLSEVALADSYNNVQLLKKLK